MDLRPIKTEDDYRAALAEIETVFQAKPETPEGDRLDILTLLVEAYEERHHPIPPPDPLDALEYHLESRGLTRRDLEPHIGSRARVAEVMSHRRALTIDMIRRLHQGLGIPVETLIQPYPLAEPTSSRTRQRGATAAA